MGLRADSPVARAEVLAYGQEPLTQALSQRERAWVRAIIPRRIRPPIEALPAQHQSSPRHRDSNSAKRESPALPARRHALDHAQTPDAAHHPTPPPVDDHGSRNPAHRFRTAPADGTSGQEIAYPLTLPTISAQRRLAAAVGAAQIATSSMVRSQVDQPGRKVRHSHAGSSQTKTPALHRNHRAQPRKGPHECGPRGVMCRRLSWRRDKPPHPCRHHASAQACSAGCAG